MYEVEELSQESLLFSPGIFAYVVLIIDADILGGPQEVSWIVPTEILHYLRDSFHAILIIVYGIKTLVDQVSKRPESHVPQRSIESAVCAGDPRMSDQYWFDYLFRDECIGVFKHGFCNQAKISVLIRQRIDVTITPLAIKQIEFGRGFTAIGHRVCAYP
jgi:hypothetical protein